MFETLPPTDQAAEQESLPESRFGDRDLLNRELRENPVTIVGPLAANIPSVRESTNQVELGVLVGGEAFNEAKLAHIDDERGGFYAVFKPVSGENTEVKESTKISSFYLREMVAAHLTENLLDFDITPPIASRLIDGELGSLQMYLSHEHYVTATKFLEECSNFEDALAKMHASTDHSRIALLDFIILGADRSDDNMLIHTTGEKGKLDFNHEEGQPDLVAIDNAISFSLHAYNADPKLVGPSQMLSSSRNLQNGELASLALPIPENLRINLAQALTNWDSFYADETTRGLVNEDAGQKTGVSIEIELEWARQRIAALVETGIFLSRANCKRLPEHICRESAHPHPAFASYQENEIPPFLRHVKKPTR